MEISDRTGESVLQEQFAPKNAQGIAARVMPGRSSRTCLDLSRDGTLNGSGEAQGRIEDRRKAAAKVSIGPEELSTANSIKIWQNAKFSRERSDRL